MNQHQQNETVNFQQLTKNPPPQKKGKERREKEGKEKEMKREREF